MLLTSLINFSHTHCVAICAFLVPANVCASLCTLILLWMRAPQIWLQRSVALSVLLAGVMILHVLTWLLVGVIMPPTFILLWLATTCLLVNSWAIAHPSSMLRLMRQTP